jgi:DAK2 domain fusion protein YloV
VDAAVVAAWSAACVRSLDSLCADIDGMNVFPVADADTGSNMLYTFTGAHAALAEADPAGAGEALTLLARGAVAAARGNSGVILSQLLLGVAESAGGSHAVDGPGLAAALRQAELTARAAVVRPVEGTMLSVLRAASENAANASSRATVAEVAATAAKSAAAALARTPQQLAVLADAGVVDAGGRGVLAVLDELAAVLSGEPAPQRPEFHLTPKVTPGRQPMGDQPWEVMYLLDGVTDPAVVRLRDDLSGIGDCVTIATDGAGSHAVHVHCADIGAALEAGLRAARPRQVRVESLAVAAQPGGPRAGSAVLAVVAGAELAELCKHEGITVLGVRGRRLPSARSVERAIADLGAAHVTVLGGGAELTGIAEEAAESAVAGGGDVVVIPCASPVQVLAAIAVHDAERRTADNVVAMAEAAAATRRGELTMAGEDAITWVGRAHAGDVVGFVDDEVVLIAPGQQPTVEKLAGVAANLLELMLSAGGELVTVLVGAEAPDGIGEALAELVAGSHPEVELAVYPGGQHESVLSFGVE